MAIYGFAAVVAGLDVEDFAQLDRLFTEDFDMSPGDIDGVTTLEVEVEAPSGEDALKTFHDHICRVGGITVERIDEDLVNISEIAVRLDVSRETPRSWLKAGSDVGFPFPKHRTIVGSPGKPQKLWCWADVYAWASTTGRGSIEDQPVPLDASVVTWFNGQLLRQVEPMADLALIFVDVQKKPDEEPKPRPRGEYSDAGFRRSSAMAYHSRSDQTIALAGRQASAGWLAGASR